MPPAPATRSAVWSSPGGPLLLEHLLPLLADGLAEELGFGFSVVKAGEPAQLKRRG